MRIIIATVKSWNIDNAKLFRKKYSNHEIFIISDKSKLTLNRIRKINPHFIFFPHWSWIIPKDIFQKYSCVVFHMTDLPYGRGGSPLQNLIVNGKKKTKISAIKVTGIIDAGPIYLKRNLHLNGNADEILKRASGIIFFKMMRAIIEKKNQPVEQNGKITVFTRRKPDQGSIGEIKNIKIVYNYIRMLDGEGYPRSFLDHNKLHLEFSNAKIVNDTVIANVEIRIKSI